MVRMYRIQFVGRETAAGELIQIDGTPYDWFNDGRAYALHLAVDDAGTEVLAGWFMPTCATGKMLA